MSKKLIACLDSNIYISALGFGGKPLDILNLALNQKFLLVTSQHILDEVDKNLNKIGFTQKEIDQFLSDIFEVAECFSPTGAISVAEYPEDDLVIETALMGFADILVTGDKAILEMRRVGVLRIEKVSVFLSRFI